ncbi:nuclear pore complex protein Nup54-like [Macrobrachium nipponense]|uniref:nuclear pore complex protein Nup54-like n=1 Tax=Macrobrachium nipponense TaxID=159736 RepID=UPI0030C8BE38
MATSGFTFSTPSASGAAAPAGGFSFGGPSAVGTTGSTGFGFGSTTAPGTSTGTAGFGFGGTGTGGTTTTSTGFGFGGTGTVPATSSTGFSFGGTGTGGPVTSSTGFTFGGGTPGTTTAASPFGSTFGTGTSSAGQGFNFGTSTSQANKPAFGFGFGNPPASGGSNFLLGSSFGAKPNTGFGTQGADANQQLQFNTGQPDQSLALHLAICAPSYFNNENDEVLRKWNQLQAFWGAGKGYYAQNMPPAEFTPENPYCRFKTVCYAKIPNFKNEDGIVHVVIGKSISDVEPHKSQIISTLSSSVFNGAEVVVDDVYASELPDKTNFRMYVQQHGGSGEKQRAPATEVCRHMGLPSYSQTMKNLCIQDVLPLQAMSEVQKKEYLDTPQRGV